MIFSEWIRGLRHALAPVSDEYADYEARTIATTLCGGSFASLLVSREKVPEAILRRADAIVEGRRAHVPLAYLLERTDFCGLSFSVSPKTLIPRADTEILAEQAIAHLPPTGKILDICTGSGCILLAALDRVPSAVGEGLDVSDGALAIARQNAAALSLAERAKFSHADVFAPDFLAERGSYDVICANPPYIPSASLDALSPEVKREPRLALDGGADGLRFYRRLLAVCPPHLEKGGTLLLEIGYDQREALETLCAEHGFSPVFLRDFGGNVRVCEILF